MKARQPSSAKLKLLSNVNDAQLKSRWKLVKCEYGIGYTMESTVASMNAVGNFLFAVFDFKLGEHIVKAHNSFIAAQKKRKKLREAEKRSKCITIDTDLQPCA